MARKPPVSQDAYQNYAKDRGIDLRLLALPETDISEMFKHGHKEGRDVRYKSRDYKRAAEIHHGVVDPKEEEPFERNLREEEGRRYLLWRKVTG